MGRAKRWGTESKRETECQELERNRVPRAGTRLEMQAVGLSLSHLPSPDAPSTVGSDQQRSRQGVGTFAQPAEAGASMFHSPSPANSEVPGRHLPTTQRVRRTPVPGAKKPASAHCTQPSDYRGSE